MFWKPLKCVLRASPAFPILSKGGFSKDVVLKRTGLPDKFRFVGVVCSGDSPHGTEEVNLFWWTPLLHGKLVQWDSGHKSGIHLGLSGVLEKWPPFPGQLYQVRQCVSHKSWIVWRSLVREGKLWLLRWPCCSSWVPVQNENWISEKSTCYRTEMVVQTWPIQKRDTVTKFQRYSLDPFFSWKKCPSRKRSVHGVRFWLEGCERCRLLFYLVRSML